MPAKNISRINEDGIYLHIYNRGIENRAIFNEQQDFEVFLGYLDQYLSPPKDLSFLKKEFRVKGQTYLGAPHQPKNYFNQVELLSYSLYNDHFHLVLKQLTDSSVQKLLRSLCTRYSIYYNKKYQHSGAVFAGAYKSTALDQSSLVLLSGYLHQNKNYSSLLEYLGNKKTAWIKTNAILDEFPGGAGQYHKFVENFDLKDNNEVLAGLILETKIDGSEKSEKSERSEASEVSEISDKSEASDESEKSEKSDDSDESEQSDDSDESDDSEDSDIEEQIIAKTRIYPHQRSQFRYVSFFVTSTMVFAILFSLGLRNIMIVEAAKSNLMAKNTPTPTVQANNDVLGERSEKPDESEESDESEKSDESELSDDSQYTEASISATLKVSIEIKDGSDYVNIRKKASVYSEKLGEALNGQLFEMVSKVNGWYEVEFGDMTGFISSKYIKEENTL